MGDPAKEQAKQIKRAQREALRAEKKRQRAAKWEERSRTMTAPLDRRRGDIDASTAALKDKTQRKKAASRAARDEARAAGAGWYGRQNAANKARKRTH